MAQLGLSTGPEVINTRTRRGKVPLPLAAPRVLCTATRCTPIFGMEWQFTLEWGWGSVTVCQAETGQGRDVREDGVTLGDGRERREGV